MHAVVEKEVQTGDRIENAIEPAATRALNQCPPGAQILWNGRSDLGLEFRIDKWRLIDAEEMSIGIALERLQNRTRRDAAADAGFDDRASPRVHGDAPRCPRESRIRVVPAAECSSAEGQTLCGK